MTRRAPAAGDLQGVAIGIVTVLAHDEHIGGARRKDFYGIAGALPSVTVRTNRFPDEYRNVRPSQSVQSWVVKFKAAAPQLSRRRARPGGITRIIARHEFRCCSPKKIEGERVWHSVPGSAVSRAALMGHRLGGRHRYCSEPQRQRFPLNFKLFLCRPREAGKHPAGTPDAPAMGKLISSPGMQFEPMSGSISWDEPLSAY